MRVLVIGSTGFIGRFVIPLLHDAGGTYQRIRQAIHRAAQEV